MKKLWKYLGTLGLMLIACLCLGVGLKANDVSFGAMGPATENQSVADVGTACVYIANGKHEMKGGTIGGKAYGIYIAGGTFTMSGGTISNCSSYGVYLSSGTFNYSAGTISDEIYLSSSKYITLTKAPTQTLKIRLSSTSSGTKVAYLSGISSLTSTQLSYLNVVNMPSGYRLEVSSGYVVLVQSVTNYTVTISAGSGGSVSRTSVSVPSGTTYTTSGSTLRFSNGTTVTATPNSGYTFDYWSPSSGTITGSTTIRAYFKVQQTEVNSVTINFNYMYYRSIGGISEDAYNQYGAYTFRENGVGSTLRFSNADQDLKLDYLPDNDPYINFDFNEPWIDSFDGVTIDGRDAIPCCYLDLGEFAFKLYFYDEFLNYYWDEYGHNLEDIFSNMIVVFRDGYGDTTSCPVGGFGGYFYNFIYNHADVTVDFALTYDYNAADEIYESSDYSQWLEKYEYLFSDRRMGYGTPDGILVEDRYQLTSADILAIDLYGLCLRGDTIDAETLNKSEQDFLALFDELTNDGYVYIYRGAINTIIEKFTNSPSEYAMIFSSALEYYVEYSYDENGKAVDRNYILSEPCEDLLTRLDIHLDDDLMDENGNALFFDYFRNTTTNNNATDIYVLSPFKIIDQGGTIAPDGEYYGSEIAYVIFMDEETDAIAGDWIRGKFKWNHPQYGGQDAPVYVVGSSGELVNAISIDMVQGIIYDETGISVDPDECRAIIFSVDAEAIADVLDNGSSDLFIVQRQVTYFDVLANIISKDGVSFDYFDYNREGRNDYEFRIQNGSPFYDSYQFFLFTKLGQVEGWLDGNQADFAYIFQVAMRRSSLIADINKRRHDAFIAVAERVYDVLVNSRI